MQEDQKVCVIPEVEVQVYMYLYMLVPVNLWLYVLARAWKVQ